MKIISPRTLSFAAALTVVTALAPVAAATSADASGVTVTSHFVVTDDPAANVSGDSAYLDNGATDDEPHALVFMALNDTPGGVCGCAVLHAPLGVWYDSSKAEWAVFTEDDSAMPARCGWSTLTATFSGTAPGPPYARARASLPNDGTCSA